MDREKNLTIVFRLSTTNICLCVCVCVCIPNKTKKVLKHFYSDGQQQRKKNIFLLNVHLLSSNKTWKKNKNYREKTNPMTILYICVCVAKKIDNRIINYRLLFFRVDSTNNNKKWSQITNRIWPYIRHTHTHTFDNRALVFLGWSGKEIEELNYLHSHTHQNRCLNW